MLEKLKGAPYPEKYMHLAKCLIELLNQQFSPNL